MLARMSTAPVTPPGWYPQHDGTLRYWDGGAWTSLVVPGGPNNGPSGAYWASMTPQDGQPWPPVATSPGRYAPGLGGPIRYSASPSTVAPKSPGLALVASFLVPGLGQLVNGELAKGAVFLLAYLAALISVFAVIGLLAVPVVWVWAMVDAYRSAREWNLRLGTLG